MRKDKINKLFRTLVNLQFEVAGHIIPIEYEDWFEYVKENPIIEDKDWFSYYTISEDKEDELRKISIGLIRKELKMNIDAATKEYGWFNLSYGLRTIGQQETL